MRLYTAAVAGLLAIMILATTTACQTVKGAARDADYAADKTGEAIDDAVD